MSLRRFSESDLEALRAFVLQSKQEMVNQPPTRGLLPSRVLDQAAPEAYVARVTSPIPALTQSTGTADEDTPGSVVCSLYRIDSSGNTEPIGTTRIIYNLSPNVITSEWIPVVRTAGGPWISYCGEAGTGTLDCPCACEHCSDELAPCCWFVFVRGVKDGTCKDCESINSTAVFRVYLAHQFGTGTGTGTGTVSDNSCVWVEEKFCTSCGTFRFLIVEVIPPGVDPIGTGTGSPAHGYRIRVTFGGLVWEKDYGQTKPNCCFLPLQELTLVQDQGECTGAAAGTGSPESTCLIRAEGGLPGNPEGCDNATCPEKCRKCDNCDTDDCYLVELVGFQNFVGTGTVVDGCTDCTDLNDGYYLDQISSGLGTGTGTGSGDPVCIWKDFTVCAEGCDADVLKMLIYEDGDGNFKLRVILANIPTGTGPDEPLVIWEKDFGSVRPLCCVFDDLDIPLISASGDCKATSATCKVSTVHRVGGFVDPGCPIRVCTIEGGACDNTVCGIYSPRNMAVDLGVGGWSDGLCDGCNEVQGVFVTGPGIDGGGANCFWVFGDNDYCFYDGPPGPDETFFFRIEVTTSGPVAAKYWLVDIAIDGDQGNESVARWESDTWDSEVDDCFALANTEGRITLTKIFDTHTGNACSSGSLPSIIHLFNPLA